ncbi:hypothetical protein GGR88_001525 [Sphingomonas jejuensis]|uniref:Uncharacterized protein n=1 Tax=Sphingomonas jejuensis TaxID=904715 RepID=A0ABX0XMT6_9SPHN|nr:hypothetical protein [Sphingomonas jejuensis]NJC34051.1 hypothetical protein [Sphingomonas jejuensis]
MEPFIVPPEAVLPDIDPVVPVDPGMVPVASPDIVWSVEVVVPGPDGIVVLGVDGMPGCIVLDWPGVAGWVVAVPVPMPVDEPVCGVVVVWAMAAPASVNDAAASRRCRISVSFVRTVHQRRIGS